jgi:hypothetical protein
MPTVYELPFIAPIPRGHEVQVITFNGDESPTVVLDKTTSSLYCPEALWGPLHQNPALAVTDPIAVATRFSWTVRSVVAGVCAGAMMSTNQWGGDRHVVKTLLMVEAR